ncbi:hypothetical protein ILUMI_18057, partial [Ignelater luminosus]
MQLRNPCMECYMRYRVKLILQQDNIKAVQAPSGSTTVSLDTGSKKSTSTHRNRSGRKTNLMELQLQKLSMVSILGAQIEDSINLKTKLPHPSTYDSVFFYFDPCHMIKPTHNCLVSKGKLIDAEGGKIVWKFLKI